MNIVLNLFIWVLIYPLSFIRQWPCHKIIHLHHWSCFQIFNCKFYISPTFFLLFRFLLFWNLIWIYVYASLGIFGHFSNSNCTAIMLLVKHWIIILLSAFFWVINSFIIDLFIFFHIFFYINTITNYSFLFFFCHFESLFISIFLLGCHF